MKSALAQQVLAFCEVLEQEARQGLASLDALEVALAKEAAIAESHRVEVEHLRAYLRALEEVLEGVGNSEASKTARRIVEAALGRRGVDA